LNTDAPQSAGGANRSRLAFRRILPVFKTILFVPITLLAAIVLWPFWSSRALREFSLFLSVRLLLLLAALYGTLALADFIYDRWRKGML
jgi:hypothetical protein